MKKWQLDKIKKKVCCHCGEEFPIYHFHRSERTKDGFTNCCIQCLMNMNAERRILKRMKEEVEELMNAKFQKS